MTDWLIDKSALVRLGASPEATEWANRIERGLVRVTNVTLLEVGFSARSAGDLRHARGSAPLRSMPVEYFTPAIEARAVEVQRILGERGQHRAPSIPDLLIAAVAELVGLTVLHLDKDFELIAEVTDSPSSGSVNTDRHESRARSPVSRPSRSPGITSPSPTRSWADTTSATRLGHRGRWRVRGAAPAVTVRLDRVAMDDESAWADHLVAAVGRDSYLDLVAVLSQYYPGHHPSDEARCAADGVMDEHVVADSQQVPVAPQHAATC